MSAYGPTCKRCPARILWRRHKTTGKLAPIDADPTRDGNIVIVDAEFYRVLPKGYGSEGQPRHTNHWATCTNPPPRPGKGRR